MKESTPERKKAWQHIGLVVGLGVMSVTIALSMQRLTADEKTSSPEQSGGYFIHKDITATMFWVGEGADGSNDFIHNRASAWVEDWQGSYGGVDNPENRCDHLPCNFTPQENPFYFALPYNDLDDRGNRKPSAKKIPWYTPEDSTRNKSLVKNRWIKVVFNDQAAYAQWEDAGPFEYDDFDYVFGHKKPREPRAGLDLSPATTSYLGLDGQDKVNWQFIDEKDVPPGPWRKIITRSN